MCSPLAQILSIVFVLCLLLMAIVLLLFNRPLWSDLNKDDGDDEKSNLYTGWLKKVSCILWWTYQQSRTIF